MINYVSIASVLIAAVVGAGAGAITTTLLDRGKSIEERIKDFYATETAVMVSPHGLRKKMSHSDNSFILVDLRSQEEYEREHVAGALNVPAYKDPDTSAYGDVDRIVESFRTIVAENPNKDVIVYCYSIPCMTGRKVGNILAQHDIYVKELGVGWNEWRYYWDLWNHEHEWNKTNVLDYVASGPEPGEVKEGAKDDIGSCTLEGELGC